jgi:hypothetical protein
VLERLAVDAEHDAAVHGDEAAVRVVGEALVARRVGEALDALVVEAEVEDGVHHAGHRELGARANADEQRVVRVAELATHRLLELEDVLGDLLVESVGPAAVHVVAARIGRDGESRGTGSFNTLVISARLAPLPPNRSLYSIGGRRCL